MFGAFYVMPGTSALYAVHLAFGEVNLVIRCGVFRFIYSLLHVTCGFLVFMHRRNLYFTSKNINAVVCSFNVVHTLFIRWFNLHYDDAISVRLLRTLTRFSGIGCFN